MNRKPFARGEQILVLLVVTTLVPVVVVIVAFVIFGQGTPLLEN